MVMSNTETIDYWHKKYKEIKKHRDKSIEALSGSTALLEFIRDNVEISEGTKLALTQRIENNLKIINKKEG